MLLADSEPLLPSKGLFLTAFPFIVLAKLSFCYRVQFNLCLYSSLVLLTFITRIIGHG